jgi:acetyltransferase-like isoleucine patch superfamily enzyme
LRSGGPASTEDDNTARGKMDVKQAAFWLGHPRVMFNAWYVQRQGITLGANAWISGWVDVALAARSTCEFGQGVFVPRTIEVRGNDDGRIIVGDHVTLDAGARLHVANKATLRVGDNVGVGPYNIFNAFDDLTIGDDTMFGPYININCADHGTERGTLMRLQHGTYGPVSIGRDCWLGAGVVVTKGVTIGDGSVIGAGSVVTHDVPEYTISVGSPSRVIRERR